MKNSIILITGATRGIGKQTAIAIADLGATVVVTGRNQKNGEEAVKEIKSISKNEKIDLIIADISTIGGMKKVVSDFKKKYSRLDVLINNAGHAAKEYKKTTDNFESNFAVNVIAPFVITNLLFDSLLAADNPRVISLSGGDLPSKIYLDNMQSERSFGGLSTYSQTKMLMMCLMYEFSQKQIHSKITMNICYPGQASTTMTQNVTADMLPFLMRPLFPIFKILVKADKGKSAKKAARSSVYLATSKELEHQTGIYCNKNSEIVAMPKAVKDEYNRQFIWNKVNELLVGKI